MCLAVPLKIIKIDGSEAVGERNGMNRSFRVDLIRNPEPGDYVIVHAGFAIEKLTEEQAEESVAASMELEAALKEINEEAAQRRMARNS